MTRFVATKAFAIGVHGLTRAYSVGDVVEPAHAAIAPLFCAPEGKAGADGAKDEKDGAKAEPKAEPKAPASRKKAKR